MKRAGIWVTLIPLAAGLLPIIGIHTAYVISAWEGFVPWCFPYIDSCSSISATGRHGIAYFLFKGTMIPSAGLLIIYWLLTSRWLAHLGDRSRYNTIIPAIGVIGALFLVVYVVALGAAGDDFRLQRRIGVIVYFTFTYLAQLMLVWRLGTTGSVKVEPTRTLLMVISYLLLATGLLTLLLDAIIDNYNDYDDAFEWVLALFIHIYFLVSWKSWQDTGFNPAPGS